MTRSNLHKSKIFAHHYHLRLAMLIKGTLASRQILYCRTSRTVFLQAVSDINVKLQGACWCDSVHISW